MNAFDSNDFPQSSLSFVCFALTAIVLFLATTEMTGQNQFKNQPSLNELAFYSQPHINLAPFKEEIRILSFHGTSNFKEYKASDLINQINVFPNPTSDYLNLEINSDAQLAIYSDSGKLIQTKELNNGVNTVDVSFLDSGVYFMIISSSFDSQTSRFIIEK